MKRPIFLTAFVIFLSGCASKVGTTVPGETSHQAIGNGYTKIESIEMATHTAETYCKKSYKRLAVDSMETTYHGVIEEQTRETLDAIGKAAAVAGVFLPGAGDKEDYVTTANFRCL